MPHRYVAAALVYYINIWSAIWILQHREFDKRLTNPPVQFPFQPSWLATQFTVIDQPSDLPSQNVGPANVWAFVVPFVAFMLIAAQYPQFEARQPTPGQASPATSESPSQAQSDSEGESSSEAVAISDANPMLDVQPNPVATKKYFTMVGIQVAVGLILIGFWLKTYLAHFPFRISFLAFIVGAIGIVVWIGITSLGIEGRVMQLIGFPPDKVARAAFNPYFELDNNTARIGFLALRFTLLALIVPIIEELFLRGWLLRWIEGSEKWNAVSLSGLAFGAIATATIYGVLTHPSEALAAAAWFSLVTWLMLRTGNFWDCVAAHAVTNLLLGVYILYSSQWHLW